MKKISSQLKLLDNKFVREIDGVEYLIIGDDNMNDRKKNRQKKIDNVLEYGSYDVQDEIAGFFGMEEGPQWGSVVIIFDEQSDVHYNSTEKNQRTIALLEATIKKIKEEDAKRS